MIATAGNQFTGFKGNSVTAVSSHKSDSRLGVSAVVTLVNPVLFVLLLLFALNPLTGLF